MITLKFGKKECCYNSTTVVIVSVSIRQWPEVPDSALPARTLALLVQQPLPSQMLGEEECEIG